MAWIRLDDQIAHHPKLTSAGLSSWLWVCCIGFSQKFLTDGFIPDNAIPSIASGIERPRIHIDKLVRVGLLEKVDGGLQVHDYLDFNDSAAVIKARREVDRVRKLSERSPNGVRTESERSPNAVLARAPASDPIRSDPISNSNNKLTPKAVANTTGGNGNGRAATPNGNGDGRSKRPIFAGQRLTVFEWMLDDCMNTLGTHTEAFDLHAWFFDLDAAAVRDGLVIPKTRDGNAWLQTQLVAEAQKRSLPLKFVSATPAKMTEDEAYREAARLGPMKRPHQR